MKCFVLIALALGLESATLQVAKRQDTTRALCISSFTAMEGNLVGRTMRNTVSKTAERDGQDQGIPELTSLTLQRKPNKVETSAAIASH